MEVTKDLVDKIAALANLEFEDAEKEQFTHRFAEIVRWFDQLRELDTSHVEPTTHVLSHENTMRDDEIVPSLSREETLRNAPESHDGFFVVPPVIPEK